MTEEEIARYGKPLSDAYNCVTTATHKKCPSCGLWLTYGHFQTGTMRSLGGLASKCRGCVAEYDKERRKVGLGKRTPEQDFEKNLLRYGLTVDDYEDMLTAQEGKCAICGDTASGHEKHGRLCVDHDHVTGQVRGLLCHLCNAGIGFLGDDPENIDRAAQYLREAMKDQG